MLYYISGQAKEMTVFLLLFYLYAEVWKKVQNIGISEVFVCFTPFRNKIQHLQPVRNGTKCT